MDFRKLFFESKIPNRNPISGFEVPILQFFEIVRCQFLIKFPESQFFKNRNFKIHESWSARKYQFGNMEVLFVYGESDFCNEQILRIEFWQK